MKIPRLARAVAAALVILTLAGCTKGGKPFSVAKLDAAELIVPVNNARSEVAGIAASGANDFAFRLSAALAAGVGDDSLVCSPYSVWLPLAALVSATDDAHRAQLLEALGAAGISAEDINEAASRMLYDLTGQRYPDNNNPLKIVNAIFVGDDVKLNKTFAQSFADYYRGSAINVDFESPAAVKAVNNWASDATKGLIDNIVDGFDPDTVAAIANAIYFSDRWHREFNENLTETDTFHSPSGDMDAHFMLCNGDGLTYYEDERVQAMPLGFHTGGGMYIILPKDGDAVGLMQSMTADYFAGIRRDAARTSGKLLLPRFKLETGPLDLTDMLAALGVPLFDENDAPLTSLLEMPEPLYVSTALHKAVIEVDEKGTTAAAVTIMMTSPGSASPQPTDPFEMICDRPFIFVLYGDTYDGGAQVLFTGIVNRP